MNEIIYCLKYSTYLKIGTFLPVLIVCIQNKSEHSSLKIIIKM